jgi:L-alanine-DL-glutamate epimerase-like enolase superfamily enzyme
MTNKIIKFKLFEANVTKKTKWIFVKLENDIGVFGWGEATLQGKEKEIFSNSERIFELILNKIYISPQDIKKQIPFNNIVEAAISSAIMQCLWDIEGKL